MFYKLRENKNVSVDSLEELKNSGFRTWVQRGSNLETLLTTIGLVHEKDFATYTDYRKGVKMLFRNRVDMIPLTGFLARSSVCGLGYDGDAIEAVIADNEILDPVEPDAIFEPLENRGLFKGWSDRLRGHMRRIAGRGREGRPSESR